MGVCVSTVDQKADKARSDEIDKQIEEDNRHLKKECKILLLGSGKSGKSTIVKQMNIIHKNGFSPEELAQFQPVVYKNVMESAHQVVNYMTKAGLNCADYSNPVLADKILNFHATVLGGASPCISSKIAEVINQLWQDPTIPKTMDKHSSQFYLMDSTGYFLNEFLQIGQPGYLPNEMDVLRARQKSVGISETRFTMGQLSIHMFDVGGQRSERKKWIHCFESVTSIIFCTALSEYDQVLREEKTRVCSLP
ncbi:G-protein alpha subunit [Coprinopsis sp. MPI-PUGE-AT-0042]|nr:G-protein alpha subunit [Coprinopsis sp. MPI-PUGE-AT-0042]